MPAIVKHLFPTACLRQGPEGLERRVLVTLASDAPQRGLPVQVDGRPLALDVPAGESTHELFAPEPAAPRTLAVRVGDGEAVEAPFAPTRRWTVHVVQTSHHDVGYTDIPSRIPALHARWLDRAVDFAAATRDYPEDARFRLVVEQAWSLAHFLRTAPPARREAMLALLREGAIEMTALFGNLTTELCGHETLLRATATARQCAREYDLPLLSAEHNDIPGITWGLADALATAGVKLLCAGFPYYYHWGGDDLPSFWDDTALAGGLFMPAIFWWEGPAGGRVLLHSGGTGCGGDCRAPMPRLLPRLAALEAGGYPYPVLRWVVAGGAADNSPYIADYCDVIRDWNARWVSPRLVSSTNTRFFADLLPHLPADLPVRRGDMPGQDYPVAATSTARATAVNRANHADVPIAETLDTLVAARMDVPPRAETVTEAYEEVLWHDEHTWGHHFPSGPGAAASEVEKAAHAYRAAALAHDILDKATARIADAVRLQEPGIHLVVTNPLPFTRTDVVSTPLRETDCCSYELYPVPPGEDPQGLGYVRCVPLITHHHTQPAPEMMRGAFALVDVAMGERVPFQLMAVEAPDAPVPFAAQRAGLGRGGKRIGMFETPAGLLRELRFLARDVPALGYRTYRLVPADEVTAPQPASDVTTLETAHYRLTVDASTGAVTSLLDRATGRELVDPAAPHPFGTFLVREPNGRETVAECLGVEPGEEGVVCTTQRTIFAAPGHPHIVRTLTLYHDVPRVEAAFYVLKDGTPLLEALVPFPFAVPGGAFTYEGPLGVHRAGVDLLPGAYADRLTVQDWVLAANEDVSVIWSSLDAPIVSLGRLWPGRVSPAHACVPGTDLAHPPQQPEELRGGWIYSSPLNNNFGTNFAVSQSGEYLFRYVFASGTADTVAAARSGRMVTHPLRTLYTDRQGERTLPPADAQLAVDHPAVQLLTCAPAQEGRGLMLRLWNISATPLDVEVSLPNLTVRAACVTSLAGEDGSPLRHAPHALTVPMPARGIVSVRVEV